MALRVSYAADLPGLVRRPIYLDGERKILAYG